MEGGRGEGKERKTQNEWGRKRRGKDKEDRNYLEKEEKGETRTPQMY